MRSPPAPPPRRIPPLVATFLTACTAIAAARADDPPRTPDAQAPRPRVGAVDASDAADEAKKPARPETPFDEAAWRAELESLARRADAAGHAPLATTIRDWDVPEFTDRQAVFRIPPRVERPDWLDDDQEPIWRAFLAARHRRAEATFARAVEAAGSHDRPRTREEIAAELAEGADRPRRRGSEAIALLHRALRDDPELASARAVGGWVKRGEEWLSPAVAKRRDRGEEFDPAFGWLPRGRLERYRAGERYDAGRWVDATEDDGAPRPLKRAWRVESDHWRVSATTKPEEAARLAAVLEEAFVVWRQVYGAYAWDPAELEKRFRGRGRTPLRDPFAAVLLRTRDDYLAEVTKFEPAASRSDAIYWMPTRTIWFGPVPQGDAEGPGGVEPRTVYHEGAHQVFAEVRQTSPLAGERCGFWAIEAAACYMESAVPTPFGWTVGGPDAGRVPAARERLLDDGFHVPLEELAAMGRRELQTDARIQPIYSQISGLADFFMNADGGRYREAFLEYLERVYTGAVDPDSLAKLCRRSHAELDDEYRRHLAREGTAGVR